MELTYRLNANELNEDFINTIKKLYKGKDLEVTVQVKEDETEYLLKSEANREQLLKAVKDVKNKKNLRTLNMDKLNDLVKWEISVYSWTALTSNCWGCFALWV